MNKFNPFVGYQPGAVPGTYQFQRPGGNPLLLGGPLAEAQKRRLDAAKGIGPQPTAGLAPGGAPGAPAQLTPGGVAPGRVPPANRTPGGAPAAPTAPASDADVSGMVRDLVGPQGEGGTQPEAPKRPQPLATPPGGTQDYDPFATDSKGRTIYLRRGADPNAPSANDMYVMVPGSRGSKGGWVPVSRSKQGGYAVDKEHLERMHSLAEEKIEGIDEYAETEVTEAVETAKELQSQVTDDQALQSDAVAQAERAQERAEKARSSFDDYNEQIIEQKIDPERIYRGEGGTTKRIFDTLASALAAFGAPRMGGRNLIAERIQAEKDADVAAQERELAKKEKSRDSALSYFYQETGNMDAAKNAVRALQSQQNVKKLERIAQLSKDPRAKAAAVQAVSVEKANFERYRQQYLQGAAGSISESERYLPGSSGSPARMAPLSLDDRGKVQKQQIAAEKAGGAGGGAGEAATISATRYEGLLTAAIDQLRNNYSEEELTSNINPSLPGRIARAPANLMLPGSGEKMPIIGFSERELQLKQDVQYLENQAMAAAAQLSGSGTPQEGEAQRALNAMAQAGTPAERMRYAGLVIDAARAGTKAVKELGKKAPPLRDFTGEEGKQ